MTKYSLSLKVCTVRDMSLPLMFHCSKQDMWLGSDREVWSQRSGNGYCWTQPTKHGTCKLIVGNPYKKSQTAILKIRMMMYGM